jgi:hypothetical protein
MGKIAENEIMKDVTNQSTGWLAATADFCDRLIPYMIMELERNTRSDRVLACQIDQKQPFRSS